MISNLEEAMVQQMVITKKQDDTKMVLMDHSEQAKTWLNWASTHPNVKCIEADIPDYILPKGYTGILTDAKVYGKRCGPDDAIYNKHKDLREKVARGNCVLELKENNDTIHDFVIFALKKFTGGMGDEDDSVTEDNYIWQKYFLKPVDEATRVVCTHKANGEAAHFAVRVIGGKSYIITGSKNVHMIISTRDDIEKYTEGRYQVARIVARTVMDTLLELEKKKRQRLLRFLNRTRYTAVLELLQPQSQHVEDLCHLQKPELRFVAFTSYFHKETNSLCALLPQEGIEKAREFGLKTVSYEIIDASAAEKRMGNIRLQYGFEGEVLYFLDTCDNVIGLVKKKTAWYILCRAVREKACNAVAAFEKNGKHLSTEDVVRKTKKRIKEIKSWLDLSESFTEEWITLGDNFVVWLLSLKRRNQLSSDARANFPILWKQCLQEKGKTDCVPWV